MAFDGDHSEMDDLNPDFDPDELDPKLTAMAAAFQDPEDRAVATGMAAEAVALQASLTGAGPTAGVPSTPPRPWRLKTMFGSLTALLATSSAKAAFGAVAAVSVTGGLAAADALPDPIQHLLCHPGF